MTAAEQTARVESASDFYTYPGPPSDKEKRTMAETTTTSTQAEPEHPTEQQEPQRLSPVWHRLALGGILLIAVFMNIYRLGQNGFDSYYPPAVRSMMDNW